MPWGFAAAAIGTVAGAVISGGAADSAAQTQANASTQASQTQAAAADKATQAQLDMFGQNQAREAPFVQSGTNALSFLQNGLGLTDGSGAGPLNAPYTGAMPTQNPAMTPYPNMAPFTTDTFKNSPGYQFQMQEGQNSVLNNRSALGGVDSGNTLKALTQFGQGTANQDYWNAYNQYVNAYNQNYNQYTNTYQTNANNNINNNNVAQTNYGNYTGNQLQKFNELQTIAGSGQNAAGNLGSLGANVATNVGNIGTSAATQIGSNTIGAGNSISAGQVAGAQSLSNGISGIGNNYLLMSMLNGGGFPGTAGAGGPMSYDANNSALFGGG